MFYCIIKERCLPNSLLCLQNAHKISRQNFVNLNTTKPCKKRRSIAFKWNIMWKTACRQIRMIKHDSSRYILYIHIHMHIRVWEFPFWARNGMLNEHTAAQSFLIEKWTFSFQPTTVWQRNEPKSIFGSTLKS